MRLRSKWRGLLGLLAAAGLFLVGCQAEPDRGGLAPGRELPGFEVPRLDTGTLSDRDFAGKAVVLNFWATWCLPCRAEMPALQRLSDALAPEGLTVIGVSIDRDANLAREFLLQTRVAFTNASDPDGSIAGRAWQVRAYPTTFVIGRDGRIAAVEIGPRHWDDPERIADLRSRLGLSPIR